jgi:hypothetical protein
MAKARNPITVGGVFNVSERRLAQLGVLDATLALDTRLFVDPMLLEQSSHREISKAAQVYGQHFEKIIKLLRASKSQNDPAWKAARKLLSFPEIRGTCLGYGAGSIHGRGFSHGLTEKVLQVASQIIHIGVEDPDLFQAMALFESDIGPDRISDMTTNVIYPSLVEFNQRILKDLGLIGRVFTDRGIPGEFLVNPFEAKSTPVILMPTDVLRELPVAKDWDGVASAAQANEQLRDEVNKYIGSIWERKTLRDKAKLKAQALQSKEAFDALLKAINSVDAQPYDVQGDPEGLVRWARTATDFADQHPLQLSVQSARDLDSVFKIVTEIVVQFTHLIEECGLNKELYRQNKAPKHESTAQRLFFAIAYSYCKANDIDISPEIDTGTGKVDFKLSTGFSKRVLVEVKLSTNSKVVEGYKTQLEVYKLSQETLKAIYLVIDVGKMGGKGKALVDLRNQASSRKEPLSELVFVDASIQPSASKR